jgi:hypothetical protein
MLSIRHSEVSQGLASISQCHLSLLRYSTLPACSHRPRSTIVLTNKHHDPPVSCLVLDLNEVLPMLNLLGLSIIKVTYSDGTIDAYPREAFVLRYVAWAIRFER